MSDSIDSAFGVLLWVVFVLSVITVGLTRIADPPLSTLAEEFVLIFIFSMLLIASLRVLHGG